MDLRRAGGAFLMTCSLHMAGQRVLTVTIKEGKIVWDFQTGGPVDSSPCIGPDGTVYAGSYDGTVYGFSPLKDPLVQQTCIFPSMNR